jgi:thiol-disulfide isomerase/thioredoxin/mono/diheme cytochrome c family protein
MRAAVIASVTLAAAAIAVAGDSKPAPAPVGVKLADWTLPRADNGKPWSLADDGREAKAVVVVFLGTECPISNAYAPVLSGLAKEYGPKGVLIVGVNSNRQDDAAAVARHAKEFSISFPVLKDEGTTLADRFVAKRTPEAFLLDGTRTVRYRGRIDDQIDKGFKRPQPKSRDLAKAIDAVLAGKDVTNAVTEPAGCFVGRGPKAARAAASQHEPVTYSKQVSRIVQKNCQVCHRPGEAAPFKLMNYSDAAAWSEPIREAVTEKRMPPWGADPAHGKFRNDRTLSDDERSTLLAWIDQGCPEGDPADLPPARTYPEGWSSGQPDEIFTLREEVHVPAAAPRGGMPYQYLLVGEPFKEDKWVQGVEIHPGVSGVVHHILVFVSPPAKRKPRPGAGQLERLFTDFDPTNPDGFGQIFLSGYAPGAPPFLFRPGLGKKIAKGSQLVFEMHYTPNGTACTDRSSVGLIYCKEKPGHEVRTRTVSQERFLIPPLASNHRVDAISTFDRPVVVLGLAPHMHLRGKDFLFNLLPADGDKGADLNKKEVLLSVPKYDFNWQIFYAFSEPLRLSKGSALECVAHYDNSSANPNNPNPLMPVGWGPQTSDEMMIGFVDYYYDDGE